jgi:hypothetical protein
MKKYIPLILLGLLPILGGCVGLASTVKALSGDPATVDLKFNGWGGSLEFHRSNATPVTNAVSGPVK